MSAGLSHLYTQTGHNDNIKTPDHLLNDVWCQFHITHDMSPFDFDPMCEDAFSIEWGDVNYVNPPFSNIPAFIQRCLQQGKPTYMLLPMRSSTVYWHELVLPNISGMYLLSRLKFPGFQRGSPVPFCIAVFNSNFLPKVTRLGLQNVRLFLPAPNVEEDMQDSCSEDEADLSYQTFSH